jgi:hypothetical protein
MNEENKVEKYYLNEANRMVDLLFDGNLFREDITRKDMDTLADVLGFYLQSYSRSAQKTAEFVLSLKNKKIK